MFSVEMTGKQQLEVAIEKTDVITVGAKLEVKYLSFAARLVTSTSLPTITEEDKEVLDYCAKRDNKENFILRDGTGCQCERISYIGNSALFIFSNLNGLKDNRVVGFQWDGTAISYLTDYQLASIPAGTTGDVITSGNISNYLPSGNIITDTNWTDYINTGWIKATDNFDSNLYNAKEICFVFKSVNQLYPRYLFCYPYLGYYSNPVFFLYGISETEFTAEYNGVRLEVAGNISSYEYIIYYKL